MGSVGRLSEVDGGPFPEDNLVLYDHFEAIVKKFPDELAVISRHQSPADFQARSSTESKSSSSDLRWTYADIWELSGRLGNTLLSKGFSPEKSITVFLRNQAEWPLAMWTALRLRAAFVPLHAKTADSPVELKHQLGIVDPGVIIAADLKTAEKLTKLEPEIVGRAAVRILAGPENPPDSSWISLGEMLSDRRINSKVPAVVHSPEDTVVLMFTGGTTSLPKPAPARSNHLVAGSFALVWNWNVDHTRRVVAHLPSFHSYAVLICTSFWLGGACVVYPSEAYSPAATLETIEKEKCTDMPGNPSMIDSLVSHPTAASRDLRSLFNINLGGSIVHPEVIKKCEAPPLNVEHVNSGFGMTEAGAVSGWKLSVQKPEYKHATSVGQILPGVKVRICLPGTRTLVPWGEIGELHIGCDYIYHNYPGRNEDWLYLEGSTKWVVSGDEASLGDMGELYILGRYKDLIIRGGRNISPASIENVLNVLPGVKAMIVPLPDKIAGEVPLAVVNFEENVKYSDKDIRDTVVQALGQASAPQRVIQLETLGLKQFPLTAAGKQDKRKLTAVVLEYFAKNTQDEQQPSSKGASNGDAAKTEQILAGIWSELSAQSADDIPADQPVTDFADSLLILQATSLIEKRLKKSITPEDVLKNPTIEELAQLLDRRSTRQQNGTQGQTSRAGPPSAAEIAHTLNDQQRFEKTKQAVTAKISQFNLGWEDVEDVLPAYDNGRFMLEIAARPQTFCHRFALVVNARISTMQNSLIESLQTHYMFRSVAVKYDEDTWLHVILRSSDAWMNHVVTIAHDKVAESDLPSYRYNDLKFDHASSDGPMFRAEIVPLQDSNRVGLVFNMNHSMYDALSSTSWFDDLKLCLEGKADSRPQRVPYKVFADAYYFGRHSVVAQNSCNYFVRKLQGCGSDERAQWPVQRAPGWILGEPLGWKDSNGNALDPSKRKSIDSENEPCGLKGITASIPVTDDLHTLHGINMVTLFKTAVTLFNTGTTGAGYALFSHWEAARMFPFLEDNAAYQALLPNPMDVAGGMGQRVIDKIPVVGSDKTLDLLQKIQEDIVTTSRHAHAPLYRIKDELASNKASPTAARDSEYFYDALQRQVFNWLPQLPSMDGEAEMTLRSVQVMSRADLGVAWLGSRVDKKTVSLKLMWDDAQMGRLEAEAALAKTAACVKWMLQSENWGRTVKEWWLEQDGSEKRV